MTRPGAALHGLGIPRERLHRLAAATGVPEWRPAPLPETAPAMVPDASDEPVVLLLGEGPAMEEQEHWVRPFAAWIEAGGRDDGELARCIARAGHSDLYASITTATANRLHLAARIVAALAARFALSDDRRGDIELALHEAISNAVVHGNLQVAGMKGLSVAALDRFSQELASRIADPAFAGRLVEVIGVLEPCAAIIDVSDEGTGFARTGGDGDGIAPSGRGLDLIGAIAESVELLDHGRRIRMRFAL